ncbi:HAMP domain-containing protein [Cohnella sp. OV330]|uniref:cache domain-containing sensor histidine kinase n=1 Tax=Cohnella sp. OV330 TaxID=1855288 RepID=UPI0008F2E6D3|nr:sensor histidine kinase [Cohnella sp. OV330]SFB61830.1 HAMP domain-containing protein [Cohnella sp. OV330]
MNKGISLRLASSLRNRMILIFFMIIVVPFLWFAYYAHVKSIEGISNANLSMTNNYLLQVRTNFQNYLSALNDQVNDLIGDKRLQDLLEPAGGGAANEESFTVDLLTWLYQRTSAVDAFRVSVYPIDPGRYADYLSTIGEPNVGAQAWFRQSAAQVSPSWYLRLPEKGRLERPLLSYVKRFSGLYDQTPRGIIATDVSEDQLKRFFSPSGQMIEQRLLLLRDDDGVVLYDSFENDWTGTAFPSSGFVEQFRKDSEGEKTIEVGGSKYLASFVRTDNEPWAIVSLTPLKDLTGTIDEINRATVYFLIGYLLCCVGVVLYITASFTQPIVRLVRYMRKLESGDYQQQIPPSRRQDEVGWLYRGFGSLIRKIEGLINEASRAERDKKELEFQVLSHQINPHFLYNTLESIRWKAEKHGAGEVAQMVAALGNLLRLSLNQGKEITTLSRELEQVRAYVQIEQARMGRPIRILYGVDDGLKELPFLRLLLQPLVENAIQHSIRNDFESGKILISASREGGDIAIDIIDNGGGIPPEALAKLDMEEPPGGRSSESAKGVGLRNVNNRLKLYFGDGYRLRIETGPDFGTKIALRHPILDKEDKSRPD